jgi:tyrosyl-tRNA synthetase
MAQPNAGKLCDMDFLDELRTRDLLHHDVDPELAEHLATGRRTVYCGFDPTSDSLHLGNMLQICNLKRWLAAGHRPIALSGGATGMIGDPSGKSAERNLLSIDELAHNTSAIAKQLASLLEIDLVPLDKLDANPDARGIMANNFDWTGAVGYLEFLRDVGKHFTVNQMIAKDTVRNRLETAESSISYTEFSYMLLQAFDFQWLFDAADCTIQLGGSDQWGNIVEGVSLIRKTRNAKSFAVVSPLITKSDGSKFGKSESGALFLDAKRTSPYTLHQFLLNVEDDKAVAYLHAFSFLSLEEIEALAAKHAAHPERRDVHNALADELVTMIHGERETEKVKKAAKAFFSTEIHSLDEETLLAAINDVPTVKAAPGALVMDIGPQLFDKSKSQFTQAIQQGGIYLNNEKVHSTTAVLERTNTLHERYAVLRWGKKDVRVVVLDG